MMKRLKAQGLGLKAVNEEPGTMNQNQEPWNQEPGTATARV